MQVLSASCAEADVMNEMIDASQADAHLVDRLLLVKQVLQAACACQNVPMIAVQFCGTYFLATAPPCKQSMIGWLRHSSDRRHTDVDVY